MIIFNESNIIKTSPSELSRRGFISLGWNTIINCYRNNLDECIYYDSEKKLFFKNSIPSRPVFKVIVAGSRTFNDYPLMKRKLDNILQNKSQEHNIEIVSGGAAGADCWGEHYAAQNGYSKKVFLADWDTYGLSAGPRRNEEMAKYAVGGGCVCFWDEVSRGTRNMIENAKKYKLNLLVVTFKPVPKKPWKAKGI